jgi:hypothetical protein
MKTHTIIFENEYTIDIGIKGGNRDYEEFNVI